MRPMDHLPLPRRATRHCSHIPSSDIRRVGVTRLSSFIRANRGTIIAQWLSRAADRCAERTVSPTELKGRMLSLLDSLANAVERPNARTSAAPDPPQLRALTRSRKTCDARPLTTEYRLLRQVVMDLFTKHGGVPVAAHATLEPLTVLDDVIDSAIDADLDHHISERERVRETFIAMLGHDLREPLQVTLFAAGALARSTDPAAAQAAARIIANGQRMDRMIRDLLDFAQSRLGGGLPMVPVPLDARRLIEQRLQHLEQAHPTRAIHLVEAQGDFRVLWDHDRMEQVLSNLMSNALTHGHDPVNVHIADRGNRIVIDVTNAGEIACEDLPRLFDPFQSPGRRTSNNGLGLGLFIVQQIVRAHGGVVEASSSNGSTSITVSLPREAPTEAGACT
jgi:signal transduction histidine kinase